MDGEKERSIDRKRTRNPDKKVKQRQPRKRKWRE